MFKNTCKSSYTVSGINQNWNVLKSLEKTSHSQAVRCKRTDKHSKANRSIFTTLTANISGQKGFE
jgi:hypothetical protein